MARPAILFIPIALLAGLYLASIGPYWNITPDSAGYVQWAKALAAGEAWGQSIPQPPITSVVFATILFLFPTGYTALNALTPILILLSLGLAYAFFARESGRGRAGLVVLLSLASVFLYRETTRLLSEPTYLVCSFGALLLLERQAEAGRPAWPREVLAGILIVSCALTRTIGITLAIAVLFAESRAAIRRDRSVRNILVGFSLLSFVALILWEAHTGQGYIANWFRKLLPGAEPVRPAAAEFGIVESGHAVMSLSPLAVFGVAFHNVISGRFIGVELLWEIAGPLGFLVGLGKAVRRRFGVTECYVLLYTAVVATHLVVNGAPDPRFLVPVLPFVFYYALEGASLIEAMVRRRGSFWSPMLKPLAALYLIWFVGAGIATAARGVREAHTSPFGDYPIKRRGNYDLQRLALMVQRVSRPEDRYAAADRRVMDVLTDRRGSGLPRRGTIIRDSFFSWIEANRIRYVLVDHSIFADSASLRVILRESPQVFRLVSALPQASLYEVQPR